MATPLPAVPNTIKAQLTWTLGGDVNVENILHFLLPAASFPLTAANALSLANSVLTQWAAQMTGQYTTAAVLQTCTVTDLNSITGVQAISTHAAVPGGVATAPVTAGAAMVVKFLTSQRGRSFRGRMFFPGVPQAQTLTPQTWTAAAINNMIGAFQAFSAGMAGLGAPGPATLAVVSYFSGRITNPNPNGRLRLVPNRRGTPLSSAVSTISANSIIASQRRRNLQSR